MVGLHLAFWFRLGVHLKFHSMILIIPTCHEECGMDYFQLKLNREKLSMNVPNAVRSTSDYECRTALVQRDDMTS